MPIKNQLNIVYDKVMETDKGIVVEIDKTKMRIDEEHIVDTKLQSAEVLGDFIYPDIKIPYPLG